MALNNSKGNMYEFITHTWNTVKGECFHDCTYCYMKRWGKLKPVRFDEKELKTDLGTDNFIFAGSSCDMWAQNIPDEWIFKTLCHCNKFDNKYFFQTKNPHNIRRILVPNSHVCVTLETNRHYPEIMNNCPTPKQRVEHMKFVRHPLYITIEPLMDFDLVEFVEMIKECEPIQVNIGADSGHKNLPEPPKEKIMQLVDELQKFTTIHNKANLKRILNGFEKTEAGRQKIFNYGQTEINFKSENEQQCNIADVSISVCSCNMIKSEDEIVQNFCYQCCKKII